MSGLLPCPHVADGAAEEAETQAEHRHVAEIESSLEESIHLCFEEEVVKGVEVDISRSGACREEGRPLPPAGGTVCCTDLVTQAPEFSPGGPQVQQRPRLCNSD